MKYPEKQRGNTMKKRAIAAMLLSAVLAFSGCGQRGGVGSSTPSGTPDVPGTPDAAPDPTPVSKRDAIPFEDGQLYAVAYLGYQAIDDLDYYAERYLDSGDVPIHYVSDGDYYLVIPRYDGISLSLYVEDIETFASTLRFYDPDCGPFIVQCNVSDIFTDITARFDYSGETAEFSPFISLKDGTLLIGERGLDLTKPGADAQGGVETDPYAGEYLDEGVGGTSLAISANGDGEYLIWLSIYRLTTIDDAVGWNTGDGITLPPRTRPAIPSAGRLRWTGKPPPSPSPTPLGSICQTGLGFNTPNFPTVSSPRR